MELRVSLLETQCIALQVARQAVLETQQNAHYGSRSRSFENS
ncbi:hypothetical protein [Leptospira noguchii]|nr:hypothetical protein [Leptospira noguchii]